MTSKSPVRSAEDVDEATLSYAENSISLPGDNINRIIDMTNSLNILQSKIDAGISELNSSFYSLLW